MRTWQRRSNSCFLQESFNLSTSSDVIDIMNSIKCGPWSRLVVINLFISLATLGYLEISVMLQRYYNKLNSGPVHTTVSGLSSFSRNACHWYRRIKSIPVLFISFFS